MNTIHFQAFYEPGLLEEGNMKPKTRICIFIVFFCLCLGTYFCLCMIQYSLTRNIAPVRIVIQLLDVFENPNTNFIFVTCLFLLVAFVFTILSCCFCCLFRSEKPGKTKIGEILLSHGFVTEEQLEEALTEQRLRMGEILVHAGRISPEQRERAISCQRKKYRKIGVIFKELGYSTEEDILWAIERMKRKIGEILMEKRYVSDYDLSCALTLNLTEFPSPRIVPPNYA